MKRPQEADGLRSPGPRKARVAWLCAGGIALVATLAAAGWRIATRPNFGVVDPGRVYRCAQPRDGLDGLLGRYGLKTVLNLRGGSEDDDWYLNEVRATSGREVDFYDLPLSASRRPTRRELLIVLDLLDRCRYPLLIHCKSGSDRTGLVSGLYLLSVRREPPERALEAFSIGYGHVPLFGPERLHEPFEEYAEWLKGRHLSHTPACFRGWVEGEYRSEDTRINFPPLKVGPRDRVAARTPDRR